MSDSAYTVMQGEVERLEGEVQRLRTELSQLSERLQAARAYVASYNTRKKEQTFGSESVTPTYTFEQMATTKSNGYVGDIRMPQTANGHRLRPGTKKYRIIEAVLKILRDDKSLHRVQITERLRDQGFFVDEPDPLPRVSVILSQAKGILVSNQGGEWSIHPSIISANSEGEENNSR